MDERLSLQSVDDYSDDYSSKVVATFFDARDTISGPEILKLSAIHQVNLFVIQELLRAWKHEGQKLRSPYFDYNHNEVKDALDKFQNVLSNHILITRENFQPLLKKAVSRTIFLMLNPYDFFSDVLDRQGSSAIRTADLRNEIRYLRINRPPLEKLVLRLEEKKQDVLSGKEAFGLLDTILEEVNFTPEEVEPFLKELSLVAPVSLDKFYDRKAVAQPKPAPPVVEPKKAEPAPVTPRVSTETAPRKDGKPTLADDFQRISSIKDSLTINQKFMFTKILFQGDFEIFSQSIEKLDRFDNLNQAMNYLGLEFPEWDKESEEYEEFIELVEKRFN